jgi:hypothetical protein
MTDSFMIGVPVETVSLKNGQVVSARKTEYKDTLGVFLPKVIHTLQISDPLSLSTDKDYYKPELYFDKYNSCGKPLQIRNAGTTTVYLWGYKGHHYMY